MTFKIFYAWQSDRPNNLCRSLIRRALEDAVKELEADPDILDAKRDGIEIDSDTQDIPGSPPVAETIFEKIRRSKVFVADLTPIAIIVPEDDAAGHRRQPPPNPNVMLEYGYALGALGDQRLIGVLNEAFGKPDDLPFDLQLRRWPIGYQAAAGADDDQRRQARQDLAKKLITAIRPIIQAAAEPEIVDAVTNPFAWDEDLFFPNSRGRPITVLGGPYISLDIYPHATPKTEFPNVAIQEIAWGKLRPLAVPPNDPPPVRGWCKARGRSVAGVFIPSDDDPSAALSASMLTCHGSFHGIAFQFPGSNNCRPTVPVPMVEEALTDGLKQFLYLATDVLDLKPPLHIEVGLKLPDGKISELEVPNRQLGFSRTIIGEIVGNRICSEFDVVSYDEDPERILLPFFEKIFDEAGCKRSNFI